MAQGIDQSVIDNLDTWTCRTENGLSTYLSFFPHISSTLAADYRCGWSFPCSRQPDSASGRKNSKDHGVDQGIEVDNVAMMNIPDDRYS
ncbi:hypothetical protein RB195_021123 [Necator americanus]|uniref:CUB domain-containing protein n=1 Tax=Necator americanus TaxID=51031 RepID=A0ABR1E9Q1_NECAM